MSLKIRNLNKKNIPACLKVVLETGASSSRSEAKKVMEFSLAPGIKPLNLNYYVMLLDNKIIGVSGLYYDYEDPKNVGAGELRQSSSLLRSEQCAGALGSLLAPRILP